MEKEKEIKEESQEIKQEAQRDFEKEIKELNEQINALNTKVFSLELENKANIKAFQDKAASFETKAQEELNKFKATLNVKFEEDKVEMKKYGSQKLLESLIEPLLNIQLAIKVGSNVEGPVQNYVRGFEMLMNQLDSELESFGVSKIEPKVGDEFDPALHYAISTKEGQNKNKVSEVKKPGYKLHDRIIKPATVVIEN